MLRACGISQLLDAALAGYNVTIFAYGQTVGCPVCTPAGRVCTMLEKLNNRPEQATSLDDFVAACKIHVYLPDLRCVKCTCCRLVRMPLHSKTEL